MTSINKILTPTARQMEWFQREQSAFFHFGMNTFTNSEWGDGTESPETFAPENIDCRQWISTIKAAGFKAAILTAKHHDGFCLWPSKYTEHSIKNSPYKNGNGDIVKEFVDACNEFGIKPGLYLSPWDRHEKTWGTDEYNDFYAGQLTELMTNYGKIYECWWDGAGSDEANYDWGRWAFIVRNNQPDCVIFGPLMLPDYPDIRWVGNERGVAGVPCWATTRYSKTEPDIISKMANNGFFNGNLFRPAESDVSIRPGWFYHEQQNSLVKTSQQLVKYWFESVGRNTGMLLNIPPSPDGVINDTDAKNLMDFYKFMQNGFSSNLAKESTVTSKDFVDTSSVEMLLLDDYDKYSLAKEEADFPEIVFEFKKPVSFNCIKISEVIEFGHRIRGFKIEIIKDGNWHIIFENECIGYCFAEHFDTLTTNKVKLTITESAAPAAIRNFGIYLFSEEAFIEKTVELPSIDLSKNAGAKTIIEGNDIIVDLGGIFPFNTVIFDSENIKEYELFYFDGQTYQSIIKGDNPNPIQVLCFDEINCSYKIKLHISKLFDDKKGINPDIKIYNNTL